MRLRPRILLSPPVLTGGVLVLAAACSGRAAEEGALVRGDQAWVRGDVEEALAEYRLALLRGSTDADVYARIGHAYAELGKIDEATEHYREATEADSSMADQAVSDLVRLARAAEDRGDRFGVAAALEATSEFRPGVSVAEMALPLARYYSQNGEFGRALPYYGKALAQLEPDSAPEVLYETGMAYEQLGDCESALVFYEQFAEMVSRAQRSEVNFRVGECSYLIAIRIRRDLKRARDEGVAPPGGFVLVDTVDTATAVIEGLPTQEEFEQLEELALLHLDRTITIGEPRSRQAQAFYEVGDLLASRGECDAAVEAFRQVARVDPSGTGTLVARARERIDEIRFRPTLPPFPGQEERGGC